MSNIRNKGRKLSILNCRSITNVTVAEEEDLSSRKVSFRFFGAIKDDQI